MLNQPLKVFIDPYMFELSDVNEIEDNIRFFQEIIRLCNSNKIIVFLYQGLYERIKVGEARPFPIDISSVKNPSLKEQILIINGNFHHAISNGIQPIDIGECFDKAKFTSEQQEIDRDSLYYELLSILIMPCYKKDFIIEKKILTGNKNKGLSLGSKLRVKCNCADDSFNDIYVFSGIDELISLQDNIFYELQYAVKSKAITFIEKPQVIRGDHHNFVQTKDFSRFDQLTRKNREVLNLLRFFGMTCIIFEDFHRDSGKVIGSIKAGRVEQVDSQDILHADFYAETGYRYGVRIFFPKDIGYKLFTYLDGDFSYQNVEKLKSLLGLTK